MKKLPGIQLLRGVAALLVLALHANSAQHEISLPEALPLDGLGDSGVDIFFVISGFVMFYTTRKQFGSWRASKEFVTRRILRIVPLYWLLTLLLVVKTSGIVERWRSPATAHEILASLFFVPADWPLLRVGWTLNYEMYFYAIFAVCLCFVSQRLAPWVIIATVCGVAFMGHLLVTGPTMPDDERGVFGWHFFANTIVVEFCFGILIAYFASESPSFPKVTAGVFGAIALLASPFLFKVPIMADHFGDFRVVALGVPAALLVFAFLGIEAVGRGPLLIGDASYSIYLTHIFTLRALSSIARHFSATVMPPSAWMAVFMALATAVGVATFIFIERPVTRYLQSRRHVALPA